MHDVFQCDISNNTDEKWLSAYFRQPYDYKNTQPNTDKSTHEYGKIKSEWYRKLKMSIIQVKAGGAHELWDNTLTIYLKIILHSSQLGIAKE